VIPKALTAQGRRAQRKQPDQNGIAVPGGKLALAGRGQRPIQGREQDILADRRPLVPFRSMGVDGGNDGQLLGDVPKRSGGTEIPLLGIKGVSRSLRQAFEQLLSRAEVAQQAEARTAALIPIGLDDAPVAFSAHGVGLEAWHDSYIHNLGCPVNKKRNLWWCGLNWYRNAYLEAVLDERVEAKAILD
jgi:hypothetical protein